MSKLTDEAGAAYAAEESADQAAREAERRALRQAATDALRAVLTRPDGTRLTIADAGLSVAHTDLPAGLVVWSDGTVGLAARLVSRDPIRWEVYPAADRDGWTVIGPQVLDLGDLGRALAAL